MNVCVASAYPGVLAQELQRGPTVLHPSRHGVVGIETVLWRRVYGAVDGRPAQGRAVTPSKVHLTRFHGDARRWRRCGVMVHRFYSGYANAHDCKTSVILRNMNVYERITFSHFKENRLFLLLLYAQFI